MIFNATVSIQKEENWYVAKCLENNVASQGISVDESLANLKEALELYYEDADQLPEPKQTFITTMEIAI
jgi:predicted RNase H-like HicB family nuclease